jgi:hypothetical protein
MWDWKTKEQEVINRDRHYFDPSSFKRSKVQINISLVSKIIKILIHFGATGSKAALRHACMSYTFQLFGPVMYNLDSRSARAHRLGFGNIMNTFRLVSGSSSWTLREFEKRTNMLEIDHLQVRSHA